MKSLKKTKLLLLVALINISFFTPNARSETPEEKGYNIAKKSDQSDAGFGDSTVNLKMILTTSSGRKTSRELSIKTLEVPDLNLGDKGMTVFNSPADIDGTALLSHAKILDADDQWLFLPALKRVKRISSKNKSGPFVGSEFAYEDITGQELNKYKYKYLRTENLGSLKCDVIERIPLYKYSGYTRQIAWIDQKNSQVRKVEFYDRKNSHMKTLILSKYKLYNEKFWRSLKWVMQNIQTKKSTELIFSDYKFNTGLTDRDFHKNALKRAR